MAEQKKPKKRTNREIVSAIMDLNTRVQHAIEYTNHVDKIFGLYLDFEDKRKLFNDFIETKVEEERKQAKEKEKDEQKANGEADPENIPKDPDNKGSRAEGVREE